MKNTNKSINPALCRQGSSDGEANPFYARTYCGIDSYWLDAESRLARVREFDSDQCLAALKVEDLQKTVRLAIECRIRRLGREAHRTVQEILGYRPPGGKK